MIIQGSPEFGDIENIKKFLEFFLPDAFVRRERARVQKLKKMLGKRKCSFLVSIEMHRAVQLLDCINYLIREDPQTLPTEFTRYYTDIIMLSLTANGILKLCHGDLNRLGPNGFIRKIKDRILDQRGFYHVMYELQMASFLSMAGKKVEFQDVSDKEWPDLHASDESGSYYVECKRLAGPSMLLEQTSVEICKMLDKSQKTVRIDILPRKLPASMEEVNQIVKAVERLIVANQNTFASDELDIRITSLASQYEDEIFLPADKINHDHVSILGNLINFGGGRARFESPVAITIKSKEIALPTNPLETELKKGYSQIKNVPETEVGIVCIDISPYITTRMLMKDTEFLQVEAQAKATINRIFGGPHFRRLGGVILTYNFKRLVSSEITQVQMKGSQIVHDKAKMQMPKDFLTKEKPTGTQLIFQRGNPVELISEGIQAATEGRLAESVVTFDNVTLFFPQMIEDWLNKALSLRAINKRLDAINVLKDGLLIHQKNKQLLTELARCYGESGDYDSTLKIYDELLQIDPKAVRVWFDIAQVYFAKKDLGNVKTNLQKALELDANYDLALKLWKICKFDDSYPKK